MPWHDAISEGLPPPDGREPPALRADIVDELRDHLECAMRRELLKTSDDETARRAVLERFGDPKALARQLWWAAMKERVMKDKLFSLCLVIATWAIVAAFILPWAARQNQANDTILKRLESVDAALAKSSSWSSTIPVKLRFVYDSAMGNNGGPVAGITVKLIETHFNALNEEPIERVTDAGGVADFGVLNSGHYQLAANLRGLSTFRKIYLPAGQTYEQTIAVPRSQPPPATIRFRPPDDKQLAGSLIECYFTLESTPFQAQDPQWEVQSSFVVFLSTDGTMVEKVNPVSSGLGGPIAVEAAPGTSESGMASTNKQSVQWPAGKYALAYMMLHKPLPPSAFVHSSSLRRWESSGQMTGGGFGRGGKPIGRLAVFVAQQDGANVWEIPLPDELLPESQPNDSSDGSATKPARRRALR